VLFALKARAFPIDVGRGEKHRGGEAVPSKDRKGVRVEVTVTVVKRKYNATRRTGRLEGWKIGRMERRGIRRWGRGRLEGWNIGMVEGRILCARYRTLLPDKVNRSRKTYDVVIVVMEELHLFGEARRRSIDPIVGVSRFRLI
jgi:hypothetical protein